MAAFTGGHTPAIFEPTLTVSVADWQSRVPNRFEYGAAVIPTMTEATLTLSVGTRDSYRLRSTFWGSASTSAPYLFYRGTSPTAP